ncbi:MAG TPA: phosphoserine phosphatase SerB [Kofleriaceae bacterium]|nr:phosphoserine phosphatase SerB [Kofleriaceae bacterium]
MNQADKRVLVTVTGADTPGITASLTRVIADNGAALLDIEQVVVQGQLILALLLGVDSSPAHGEPVLKDLLFTAKKMGLDLQFTALEVGEPHGGGPGGMRYAVTAIGDTVDARAIHVISSVLARHDANIETIRRLSDGHLASVEVIIHLPAGEDAALALRRGLMEATTDLDVDLAVQRETLSRRTKRLVIMDMDSTLIQIEVIDELARMHGVVDQVSEITRRAMAGELDFEASLRERVALLEGLEYERVLGLARDLPVTDGARDMLRVLRTLGYKTGVISGGFTFAANMLKEQLGLDYAYANQLEIEHGRLTGRVMGPIITPQRKADLLDTIAQGEGITLAQTIAIGDGANDLAMLERAGLGIAFHAKAKLKAAADTAVSRGGLDRILYLLGLHARDVKQLLER